MINDCASLGFDLLWKDKIIFAYDFMTKGISVNKYKDLSFLNRFWAQYKKLIESNRFRPVKVLTWNGKYWGVLDLNSNLMAAEISKDTGMPIIAVNAYLLTIARLYKTGAIEETILNPKIKDSFIEEIKSYYTGGKIIIPLVLIVGALVAISNLSKR